MRLLFDQNISFRIVNKLKDYFPDCKHVSDVWLKNCDDPDIWIYAHDHNFVIVTFDSDFYDISLLNGFPPKIIWIRTGNLTTLQVRFCERLGLKYPCLLDPSTLGPIVKKQFRQIDKI